MVTVAVSGAPFDLAVPRDCDRRPRCVAGRRLGERSRFRLVAATAAACRESDDREPGGTAAAVLVMTFIDALSLLGSPSSDDRGRCLVPQLGSAPVRSRYVTTNGVRLFCLEAGPPAGPMVLLLHGFPELAYSWRHQVAALGAAGFHVVAPDLPGYGRSDKPDVTYDCEWINASLIGVVDACGHERAVVAGHDWGGILVWTMARQYPSRIAGVIGVNTPGPSPPADAAGAVAAPDLCRHADLHHSIPGARRRRMGARQLGTRRRRLRRDDLRSDDTEQRRVRARSARRLQGRVPSGRRAHTADRVLPKSRSQLGAHRARSRIVRSTCRA